MQGTYFFTIKNDHISNKLRINNITILILRNINYDITRMDKSRNMAKCLVYIPRGRRNVEYPKKRWEDQLNLEDEKSPSDLILIGN